MREVAISSKRSSGSSHSRRWPHARRARGLRLALAAITIAAIAASPASAANRYGITSYSRMAPGAPHHGFFYNAWQPFTAQSNTITLLGATVGTPGLPGGAAAPETLTLRLCSGQPPVDGSCPGQLAEAHPQIVNYGDTSADIGNISVTPGGTYWIEWLQPAPYNGGTWVTYWWEGGSTVETSEGMQAIVQGYNRLAPTVATGAATSISQTAATLDASVNPNGEEVTACKLEYGISPSYESSAPCLPGPGGGEGAVGVAASIAGLAAKTTYHYRIVATNAVGMSYGGDAMFKTLPEPPTVTGVDPDAGLVTGNEDITITGTEFSEASAVEFDGTEASFKINSPTSITATTPASLEGTIDVTVTNPGGTSATEAPDRFTFVRVRPAPTITKLSAKKGPAAGGTSVTISGTGFVGVTAVKFGSTNATSFVVNSTSSITAVSPAGTSGTVEVTVRTPNGLSGITKKARYAYEQPTVTIVSPGSGGIGGGTPVTVTGSGFAPGTGTTAFLFGKGVATSVDCTSTTQCTMVSPAALKAEMVDVVAKVGPKKSKKTSSDQFAYS